MPVRGSAHEKLRVRLQDVRRVHLEVVLVLRRNEFVLPHLCTANDSHQVSDEVKPDWDLTGAVEDTRLLFRVGLRIAPMDRWPEWKPGTEFKAKRDAMLGGTTN